MLPERPQVLNLREHFTSKTDVVNQVVIRQFGFDPMQLIQKANLDPKWMIRGKGDFISFTFSDTIQYAHLMMNEAELSEFVALPAVLEQTIRYNSLLHDDLSFGGYKHFVYSYQNLGKGSLCQIVQIGNLHREVSPVVKAVTIKRYISKDVDKIHGHVDLQDHLLLPQFIDVGSFTDDPEKAIFDLKTNDLHFHLQLGKELQPDYLSKIQKGELITDSFADAFRINQ